MNKFEIAIKIILAILFSICLIKMPYGYYQLIRFLALVSFGILAYSAYKNEKNIEMIIFVSLAILFQPFIKIPLGREIWKIVDILVALGLMISLFLNKKTEK